MMGFLHPKRGFRIRSKNEGYFGAHPVWAVQSPETPSILFMVTIRASKPSQGFSPFLEGKSIFFRKKEKALPEPSCSRVFVLRSNIIWGPGFWNLAFFYENPGLGHAWFSSIYITCVDVYLSLIFLFLIFIEVKSEICEEHEAMQIHEPFFLKKGSYVQGGSENGRAHEPESEITFRLVSPSNLLRDMNAWALF